MEIATGLIGSTGPSVEAGGAASEAAVSGSTLATSVAPRARFIRRHRARLVPPTGFIIQLVPTSLLLVAVAVG